MSNKPTTLKEALAAGWKVVGFQQVTGHVIGVPGDAEQPTLVETSGHAILLQNGSDLALCDIRYQINDTDPMVEGFSILTSDE